MRKAILTFGSMAIVYCLIIACSKNNQPIHPGNDPNFVIVENTNNDFKRANRKVDVFGISIYAHRKVSDEKLLHAANILAQYLDNDEDSIVDNPLVHQTLLNEKAALFMWNKRSNLIGANSQDLGNDETCPEWHRNGQSGRFDAALEEIWHVITHSGYSKAYPAVFGEYAGTTLCNAMDKARGGQFHEIPSNYPSSAWYTYDDKTCGYSCMATEYFYWAMTSILGAQKNRGQEINHEWKLYTKALIQQRDKDIYNLLTDPQYVLPTVLPDGTYRR